MSKRMSKPAVDDDPLWYKDGIIYQLHIKSFYDSDGDGIGDFAGLTQKLDYLQDLGVTAVWVLPFYPSPLRDDGYDIAAYTGIHPNYGSLKDFKTFLKEAHKRGLRVITELVINHTSDQHPWFQRSRRAKPGTKWRDFYVWSDDPTLYKEARIIFKDFETSNWSWDPVANSYFWHRFYHHQPDLNFENLAVHRAVFQVLDFWMEMGVDGLRLDAIPYLYEEEGTSCENLPRTHEFLKKLRAHVDRNFPDRMLLAEANQWPEDSREYFGDDDECHMSFHFPLMPRLFMSVAMEDRFPIIDIMQQTPEIPPKSQWAVFLRNHDELTLEMVTDEDRDYMYRTYARDIQARINLGIRRRLAPLLGNHRRRIELMNALLFAFPGTPIIYYGDEIGMGDNIYLGDRHGVRTPMQWSPDRNAGFSRANPQKLYSPVIIDPEYHYETINVESQQNNPHSLLWWMKRLIDLRKRLQAFGRGRLDFLHPENRKVLAFTRTWNDQTILVVANLSRFVQCVELDLSQHEGRVPIELFGHTHFPPITKRPYFLTLSPHAFFWMELQKQDAIEIRPGVASEIPEIEAGDFRDLLRARHADRLSDVLQRFVRTRRWFGAKTRTIKSVEVSDTIALPGTEALLVLLNVDYVHEEEDRYLVPLVVLSGKAADNALRRTPELAVARLTSKGSSAILFDATADPSFASALLKAVGSRKQLKGSSGELEVERSGALRKESGGKYDAQVLKGEQSNTSILYGDRFFLKLFRRLENGMNPDVEITRFLAEKTEFRNVPMFAGVIEYRGRNKERLTLASVQEMVQGATDAWRHTLDAIGRFFETMLSTPAETAAWEKSVTSGSMVELARNWDESTHADILGSFEDEAELLGRRTAELHLALASDTESPDFRPEPFSPHYQRSIYQSMRTQTTKALQLLDRKKNELDPDLRKSAGTIVEAKETILAGFRRIVDQKITATRLRTHGDYHLGQVLFTGKDFIIIDFEGEPSRPISERRIKRSPLRDVAGMLRSFHYAPYAVLYGQAEGAGVRADDVAALEPYARLWYRTVSIAFLKSYLDVAEEGPFLPKTNQEISILLRAYLMEKALYELNYELNNRPDWVSIPLRGIEQLLEEGF